MRINRLFCAALMLTACSKSGSVLQQKSPLSNADGGTASDAEVACPADDAALPDKVDMLFVIDNSPSMRPEQAKLRANLPSMVAMMAAGEVKDSNGKVVFSFPPVKSLHLGVVTPNMGISGLAPSAGLLTCEGESGFGDDAVLIDAASFEAIESDPSCDRDFPSYVTLPSAEESAAEVARKFACIASTGTNGCGFEQPLEAAWKALAPSTEDSFSRGTTGHGDDGDFLREDSVLVVVVISDEEDSSIPDTSREIFNVRNTSTEVGGDPRQINVRQYLHPELLHPTRRYVDGLLSLRPTQQDRVIFAGIIGVPPEADGLAIDGVQDFDAIVNLPEMQFREQPPSEAGGPIFPTPACTLDDSDGHSEAYPARRIVQVAAGFGKNGIIRSICDRDFSVALKAIATKVAEKLAGPCAAP